MQTEMLMIMVVVMALSLQKLAVEMLMALMKAVIAIHSIIKCWC
jgi:hypothetical protein